MQSMKAAMIARQNTWFNSLKVLLETEPPTHHLEQVVRNSPLSFLLSLSRCPLLLLRLPLRVLLDALLAAMMEAQLQMPAAVVVASAAVSLDPESRQSALHRVAASASAVVHVLQAGLATYSVPALGPSRKAGRGLLVVVSIVAVVADDGVLVDPSSLAVLRCVVVSSPASVAASAKVPLVGHLVLEDAYVVDRLALGCQSQVEDSLRRLL